MLDGTHSIQDAPAAPRTFALGGDLVVNRLGFGAMRHPAISALSRTGGPAFGFWNAPRIAHLEQNWRAWSAADALWTTRDEEIEA